MPGQNLRIEGRVLDAETQTPVPKAEINIEQKLFTTDVNGYFVLNHEKGTFLIKIKYSDYDEMEYHVTLVSDTTLTFYYDRKISIKEVQVVGSRNSGFKREGNLEVTKLMPTENSFLPGLGSNEDVLKELQLLPGVQSGGEGSSGLIVRGGQYDQNLFNLNGFPVYQPYHFSGLLSAIDPFMVSEVELMKGGFPSKYGGKLSSVVNFNTDRPVSDSVLSTFDAGILISGGATRFSPDTVTTIALSGRIGTTLPFNKALNRRFPAYHFFDFYDININITRKINSKNDIALTLFVNKDLTEKTNSDTYYDQGTKCSSENLMIAGWSDILAGISWANNPNATTKIKTNFYFQNFRSEFTEEFHSISYEETNITDDAITSNSSQIKELGLTSDLEFLCNKHVFNVGVFSYLRNVKPEVGTFLYTNGVLNNEFTDDQYPDKNLSQIETGIYLEDKYSINKKLTFRPGIRFTVLTGFKPAYLSPEPRLLISYRLNDIFTFMGSYTISTQSVHRISSSNAMVVNDLWIHSNSTIKPSISYQGELGIFINNEKLFQSELSVYYKTINSLYIYKEGASFAVYPRWEDNITSASGTSYGAELLIQTHINKTYFLLAYTISKTTRQSPEVNDGMKFNYKYDKPHDFHITISYRPRSNLSISGNWVIQSGNMVSYYDRIIQSDHRYDLMPFMETINNIRFPLYHRLDFSIESKKSRKWGRRTLKVDVYNVYSKLNPWYLTYEGGQINQVALFPIIPSLSYKIEF